MPIENLNPQEPLCCPQCGGRVYLAEPYVFHNPSGKGLPGSELLLGCQHCRLAYYVIVKVGRPDMSAPGLCRRLPMPTTRATSANSKILVSQPMTPWWRSPR